MVVIENKYLRVATDMDKLPQNCTECMYWNLRNAIYRCELGAKKQGDCPLVEINGEVE